jgi:hypothetical protein
MIGLHIQLILSLDRNESHRWSLRRFGYSFRVDIVSRNHVSLQSQLEEFTYGSPIERKEVTSSYRSEFIDSLTSVTRILRKAVKNLVQTRLLPDLKAALENVGALEVNFGRAIYDWPRPDDPISFTSPPVTNEGADAYDQAVVAGESFSHNAMELKCDSGQSLGVRSRSLSFAAYTSSEFFSGIRIPSANRSVLIEITVRSNRLEMFVAQLSAQPVHRTSASSLSQPISHHLTSNEVFATFEVAKQF